MNFIEMISVFDNARTWGTKYGDGAYVIVQTDNKYSASYGTGTSIEYLTPYEEQLDSFEAAKMVCEAHARKGLN